MVEKATPLAEKLLAMRSIFLSRIVYQTYNGFCPSSTRSLVVDFTVSELPRLPQLVA
jgi:hypothetical protein